MGCYGVLNFICCARCDSGKERHKKRRIRSKLPIVANSSEEKYCTHDLGPRMTSKVIGSTPIGEANTKSFLAENDNFGSQCQARGIGDQDGRDSVIPTSAEYVKRTAKLFEKARLSNEKPELERKSSESGHCAIESQLRKLGNGDASEDTTDFGKKPSYLGVSCSNSGYRNVIKYDSKLREGLWSSTNQRESLVLSNHRLRDNSPLKFEQEFRSYNGHSALESRMNRLSCGLNDSVNGVGQPCYRMDEFVNISTSTKTISTFRNVYGKDEVKNKKENERNNVNSHGEETWRKSSSSYSNLGISPKILKSPEKNCNSFLRSINSFENNCKKSQNESAKTSCYRRIRSENITYSPSNSIQQRIERLYGPGALAQGFYVQNSSPRTRLKSETSEESAPTRLSESVSQNMKSSIESIPDLLPAAPEVVLPIEPYCNGKEVNGPPNEDTNSNEKNGRYFLKLLQKEIEKLESLASLAESELENGENLPEEASGKLRAAAGKARLLVRQKLHQFEGLCQKNMNEKPGEAFPTTSEDLAGFWDMVMLQVVQVYSVFDEIDKLKKNNWKPVSGKEDGKVADSMSTPESGKKGARRSTSSTKSPEKSEKAEQAKKAREETRKKMMEERRRKMKELRENKTVGNDNEIEIFAK